MNSCTDVLTLRRPRSRVAGEAFEACMREYIWRAVLMYVRRRREDLRDLSDEQMLCLVEGIAARAETSVRKKLVQRLDAGHNMTIWISAMAIHEARQLLQCHVGVYETVKASVSGRKWQVYQFGVDSDV